MDFNSLICQDEGSDGDPWEVTDTINPTLLDNALPKEAQDH